MLKRRCKVDNQKIGGPLVGALLLKKSNFNKMVEIGYNIVTYAGILFGTVLVVTSSVMLLDIKRIKKKESAKHAG